MQTAKTWQFAAARSLDQQEQIEVRSPEEPSPENQSPKASGWVKVQKKVRINDDKPIRPTMIPLKSEEDKRSAYLREGDSHRVWRPKKAPQLANLVGDLLKKEKSKQSFELDPVATTPGPKHPALTPTAGPPRVDLKSRQKTVFNRVLATQELLRETTDELLKEEDEQPKQHLSLLEASKKITANIKKQRSTDQEAKENDFSSVVRMCLTKMRSGDMQVDDEATETKGLNNGVRRRQSRRGSKQIVTGAVPLKKWKNLARQETRAQMKNPVFDRAISEYPVNKKFDDHQDRERSSSIGVTSTGNEKSFGISFAEPTSSSAINPTVAPEDVTPPPVSLMKQDSRLLMKPSKMAQLKGAVGRKGSSGLPRQNPIDVEASLTSSITPLIQERSDSDSPELNTSSSKEKNVLLSDPSRKKLGRKSSSGSLTANTTGTML